MPPRGRGGRAGPSAAVTHPLPAVKEAPRRRVTLWLLPLDRAISSRQAASSAKMSGALLRSGPAVGRVTLSASAAKDQRLPMKRKLPAAVALLGLLVVLPLSRAGAAAASRSTEPVTLKSDASVVLGSSTLTRTHGGVSFSMQSTRLSPGHAVTVWWMVVNPDGGMAVLYAAGHVIDESGTAEFGGSLKVGDSAGLVVGDHGAADWRNSQRPGAYVRSLQLGLRGSSAVGPLAELRHRRPDRSSETLHEAVGGCFIRRRQPGCPECGRLLGAGRPERADSVVSAWRTDAERRTAGAGCRRRCPAGRVAGAQPALRGFRGELRALRRPGAGGAAGECAGPGAAGHRYVRAGRLRGVAGDPAIQ